MSVRCRIEERNCFIHEVGSTGPVIFWGTFLHKEDEVESLITALQMELPDREYVLVAFLCDDWNRDFSPWETLAVFGDQEFLGQGREMLSWLTDRLIPHMKAQLGDNREQFLIGYSLSGLFALWAAYESDVFSGIASCSGSLWFPGWDAYVASHQVVAPVNVYLSLGKKEEKTKNRIMAQVGERTRMQEDILKADTNVTDTVLEWNSGGHFAEPEKRLAKGIKWLLEQTHPMK